MKIKNDHCVFIIISEIHTLYSLVSLLYMLKKPVEHVKLEYGSKLVFWTKNYFGKNFHFSTKPRLVGTQNDPQDASNQINQVSLIYLLI